MHVFVGSGEQANRSGFSECTTYLSKGTDDGALHDPSEEDEVNIFGSCA